VTTALVYGPQTDRIETLLAAVREMTPAEWAAAWAAAWAAELSVARVAERAAALDAAWDAARDAERAAGWRDAVWAAGGYAAGDAASALIVLDLVGQYGLARKHIDVLAAPTLTALPGLAYLFEPVDIAETEPRS
jgi:hypothetical protein